MSEEIQRIIGALQARVDSLTSRVGRIETAFLFVATAAIGVLVSIVLKASGVPLP